MFLSMGGGVDVVLLLTLSRSACIWALGGVNDVRGFDDPLDGVPLTNEAIVGVYPLSRSTRDPTPSRSTCDAALSRSTRDPALGGVVFICTFLIDCDNPLAGEKPLAGENPLDGVPFPCMFLAGEKPLGGVPFTCTFCMFLGGEMAWRSRCVATSCHESSGLSRARFSYRWLSSDSCRSRYAAGAFCHELS